MKKTLIIATLKHGKVLSRKLVSFFWFFLIFFVVAAIVCLVSIVGIIVANVKEDIVAAIGCMTFCIVLSVGMCVLIGIIISRDRRIKREIYEWLTDAVKLKAYCEEFGETVMLPAKSLTCVGNIKVSFKYNGDKKTARSELRSSIGSGTGKVFTRFVNNEIYIMYSPKYKQVMLLDEPCEQTQSLEIL